jgi:S1-C subfamily serine protease
MRILRPFLWATVIVAAFLFYVRLSPTHSRGPLFSGPASAASSFGADEQNNIDVYKSAHDATVNITSKVYRQNWFLEVYPVEGAGSGFIINPEGQILTNNHVVDGSSQLTVTLSDKKIYKARTLAIDTRNDLALIQIEAGRKLPALHLGDSEGLQVGQKVLAIGNPFGQFGGTLTTGIVSSLDRSIQTEQDKSLEGMIQTDAAINPGNSGGPLLDSRGNVIGINTAIYGPQGNIGIGFAMPINRAKAMLDEFQHTGHISHAAPLGIKTVFISGDLAEMLHLPARGGLLIQSVQNGTAAEDAGLRGPNNAVIVGNYQLGVGGDFITEVDGQPVVTNDMLQRILSQKRGGETLTFTVYRDGRTQKVPVKLVAAPAKI